MPRSKKEAEMLRVRPSTACLVVTYIAPPFRPRRDAAEATLTMLAGGALLEKDLDGALAAQVHGALVGLVDHVVDFLRGLVNGELTVEHAGVVDEDVQVAELLEAGVEHGLDLCRVAHVRLDRQNDARERFPPQLCRAGLPAALGGAPRRRPWRPPWRTAARSSGRCRSSRRSR